MGGRVADELLAYGSALLHESNQRRGAIGPSIRPAWPGARLAGPCRTASGGAGDNLAAHHAIEYVQTGEVICFAAPTGAGFGVWGEITTAAALHRGAAGLVTSGGVRDLEAIEAAGFPVFAPGSALQGTIKKDSGQHECPVRIGCALIRHGDWIVCDTDGCVVIAADRLTEVVASASEKAQAEQRALHAIRSGATSREALGLP